MSKSLSWWPRLFTRIFLASRLDPLLFREVKGDAAADWQVPVVIALAGLGTGTGIGLAGLFKTVGGYSLPGLLAWLLILFLIWLFWSLCAWIIGTKMLQHRGTKITLREFLRTTGYAISPGILGFFVFVPKLGGVIFFAVAVWVIVAFIMVLKHVFGFNLVKAAATWVTSGGAAIVMLIATVAIPVSSVRLFHGSGNLSGNFDSKLNSIVRSYRFSIATWELQNVPGKFIRMIGATGPNTIEASLTVEKFFSTGERGQPELDTVERIIEGQIKRILAAEGLGSFPPVNFRLSTLPRLLVISPRDKIESMREILLDPHLTIPQIGAIEERADKLGVSSLIVELGGFAGTYPGMVSINSSLHYAIDAAVEEWIHQYLAFRPLGFRYAMDIAGIKRDYEIATINEAVAGMVSEEIGAAVRRQFYTAPNETASRNTSDFYLAMREIRLAVDDYLAKGEIDAVEQFMAQKREELAAKGYYIRKLNQAYFAWHGTYANQPDSVSPIGAQLRELRSKCNSVKQFLDIVGELTGARDLNKQLAKLR